MDSSIIKNSSVLELYKLEAIDSLEDLGVNSNNETMLIGFFNSLEECNRVEKDYHTLPGFSLKSCRFVKTKYRLLLTGKAEEDYVFYVQSSEFDIKTREEESNEIGLFLSEDEAEAARKTYLEKYKASASKYGKKDYPTVYIDKYLVNKRQWQEGFVRYSWRETE